MVLIKKTQGIGDGFNGLVPVLKQLAGALHFHGRIEVQRRLHCLFLEQGAIVRYGESCNVGERFEGNVPVDVGAHVFYALDHAVFLCMFLGRQHRKAEGAQKSIEPAIGIHEVLHVLHQLEVVQNIIELRDPARQEFRLARRITIFIHQVSGNSCRLSA